MNAGGGPVVSSSMETIRLADGRCVDASSGEVRRNGVVTRLEPQPAALLALLASRPGELVTHEDIARHLWPEGTHVEYGAGVHYAVRQIRAALGDDARNGRVIETLPRRGYRLRAEALAVEPPASGGVRAGVQPPPGRIARRLAVALAVAAGLVLTVAAAERRPNRHHEIAAAVLRAVHDFVY